MSEEKVKLTTQNDSLKEKPVASVVDGKVVAAYNLVTRERNKPMAVIEILRYVPANIDGPPRYRLSGVDVDTGDKMYYLCVEKYAMQASMDLGINIRNVYKNP